MTIPVIAGNCTDFADQIKILDYTLAFLSALETLGG